MLYISKLTALIYLLIHSFSQSSTNASDTLKDTALPWRTKQAAGQSLVCVHLV